VPTLETQSGIAAASSSTGTPRKIRVLHLIHSVTHGGIESNLLNWLRFFDRDRMDVKVACFTGDRNREAAFLKAAEMYQVGPVLSVPWARSKPFWSASRALAALIREHKIDVLHTHGYYGDALGALVKLFVKVKTVGTVYVWGKYELHRQIMQAMDWVSLQFHDKVTVHCEETARLSEKLGFRRESTPVLIAGFPNEKELPTAEERRELRRQAGIADDELLMVNVARIHPEKAHDQLLKSFQIIHNKYPKTKLWISGTGWDWLEKQYIELRHELGLDDCVEFVGYRQNLWPMLHAADFMIHSSHVEGVPIAILYGMSAGLPIVVSDVGGVYEVIKQNETGVRVPENDIEGFAREVIALIEDPERRNSLAAAARRLVTTEYSIETACRRVEATYREVLGW
jgi:glycosyltransferase involved in cell wall biosynthesis